MHHFLETQNNHYKKNKSDELHLYMNGSFYYMNI